MGEESIQKLIEDGDFEEAASLSYRILGNDKHQWSTIFYKFVELGHIKIIAPFVQRCDPQLSPDIYELILDDYLKTDINVGDLIHLKCSNNFLVPHTIVF